MIQKSNKEDKEKIDVDVVDYNKYISKSEQYNRLIYGNKIKHIHMLVPEYNYHKLVELKGRLMASDWADMVARILFLSRCSFNPDIAALASERMEHLDNPNDDPDIRMKDLALEELNSRRKRILGSK